MVKHTQLTLTELPSQETSNVVGVKYLLQLNNNNTKQTATRHGCCNDEHAIIHSPIHSESTQAEVHKQSCPSGVVCLCVCVQCEECDGCVIVGVCNNHVRTVVRGTVNLSQL